MPLPLRLEGRDVDDDAATRVGRFAQANGEDVARNAEVFHRARQGEAVRWHDANVRLHVHETLRIERFGIDHRVEDVREHLELVGHPQVVPVRTQAVGDQRHGRHGGGRLGGGVGRRGDRRVFAATHLPVGERLDHAVFERHLANPGVRLHSHKNWRPAYRPGPGGGKPGCDATNQRTWKHVPAALVLGKA